jgi:hypothetical protein
MTPIFIGGTGRSGTTVLKQTLGLSSRIVSLPRELRVIVDPDGAIDLMYALSERWSPYAADKAVFRFFRMLEHSEAERPVTEKLGKLFKKLGMSPPRPYRRLALGEYFVQAFYRERVEELSNAIVHHESRGSWVGSEPWQYPALIRESGPFELAEIRDILASFFDDLFGNRASSQAQTHWVEDTPYNIVRYRELVTLFPGMRFIHICRDPRDVVASYRLRSWGGDRVEVIARRLAGIMNRWGEVRSKLRPGEYLEIRLEDLAASPVSKLKEVFEYIGLDMDLDPEELPIGRRSLHSGRWKNELTPEEIERVEPHLLPVLQMFGYER